MTTQGVRDGLREDEAMRTRHTNTVEESLPLNPFREPPHIPPESQSCGKGLLSKRFLIGVFFVVLIVAWMATGRSNSGIRATPSPTTSSSTADESYAAENQQNIDINDQSDSEFDQTVSPSISEPVEPGENLANSDDDNSTKGGGEEDYYDEDTGKDEKDFGRGVPFDLRTSETKALNGINWAHDERSLALFASKCDMHVNNQSISEAWRDIWRASCGFAYSTSENLLINSTKTWRVALVGPDWSERTLELSGCALGRGVCSLAPRCIFAQSSSVQSARNADVVVVISSHHDIVRPRNHSLPGTRRKPIKVIYWREAYWPNPPSLAKQKMFDLEMGVHVHAALRNPDFRVPPIFMMQTQVFQARGKRGFAASLISDCTTTSQRQTLIDELAKHLGNDRIHQYGKCGNREIPGHTIYKAMTTLASYKFFFAFENTLSTGYTTEKLFTTMLLPLIPVYYGDPAVANITVKPSFLRVVNYGSVKALAEHLLFLDANPTEYAKYLQWRSDSAPFTPEFIRDMSFTFPGPQEVKANVYSRSMLLSKRKTICCRLCNEDHLSKLINMRTPNDYVLKTYKDAEINRFVRDTSP